MLKKIIVGVSSLLILNQAFATNATLTINVGGAIWAQPFWKVAGTKNSSVTYTFGTYAGLTPDMDSGTSTLQLVLDSNAPVASNVNLTTPTGCSIGGTAVTDSSVKLVVAGAEKATGTVSTSTFSGTAATTTLRFKNVASTVSGAVACTGAGNLTYTF
jgi:hypothetical protein